jgi:hypothetical protein
LHFVLPALAKEAGAKGGLYPISAGDVCIITSLAASTSTTLRSRLQENFPQPVGTVWYCRTPRRQVMQPEGLTYEWELSAAELRMELRKLLPGGEACIFAPLTSPGTRRDFVYSNGFVMKPVIEYEPGAAAAGVFTMVDVASCIGKSLPKTSGGDPVCQISFGGSLSVKRWAADGSAAGWERKSFRAEGTSVQLGYGQGWPSFLPLKAVSEAEAAADPLAAWVAWVQDGKIRGSMTLQLPAA